MVYWNMTESNSYDSFYYESDGQIRQRKSLEWLISKLPTYPDAASVKKYKTIFKDKMYCPECGKARLKLIPPRTETSKPYLQAINLNEHEDGCSYYYSPRDYTRASEAVFAMSSIQQEAKLDSMIAKLIKAGNDSGISGNDLSEKNSNNLDTASPHLDSHRTKRLPEKKINALSRVEKDCFFVVYGEADISEEHSSDRTHIWFSNDKAKHLLDVWCSQKVYGYIAKDSGYKKAISDGKCYMAAFCDIKVKRAGGYIYRNCCITHSSMMKVVPVP